MRHDTLILKLLWWETRNTLCAISLADRIFFTLAGAALVAYHLANLLIALHDNAAATRNAAWLWFPALPAACLLLGLGYGAVTARIASSRVFSACLLAQPLSARARRRMAAIATFAVTAALAFTTISFFWLCCIIIQKPHPALWSLVNLISLSAGAFETCVIAALKNHGAGKAAA